MDLKPERGHPGNAFESWRQGESGHIEVATGGSQVEGKVESSLVIGKRTSRDFAWLAESKGRKGGLLRGGQGAKGGGADDIIYTQRKPYVITRLPRMGSASAAPRRDTG